MLCRPAKALVPTKSLDPAIEIINRIAYRYIDAALALSPEEIALKSSDSRYTFLHALVAVSRDRVFLRDQIVSLLLAGRDTTAAILVWAFYELARHPVIYAKLRKQVLDTIGSTAAPSFEDLKNMKYLQAVINEALRLYPLPFNVRMSLKDTTLPRGGGPDGMNPIGVPQGTPIGFSTFHLQRNQELMPPSTADFPSVDVYCPERWENWHPKPWTFAPFGGGPRICLGQQFALAEMGFTFARVAQKFERMEWLGEAKDMKYKTDIMIEPENDLLVGFWEAQA